MNKRLMILLLAFILLAGCAAPQPGYEDVFYSFQDSTGAEIVLAAQPRKVAVLFSSYAQVWTLAGGQVAVTVGESVERGFASEDAVLVDAGAGKTIDLELLLEAQPDLVIGSADIAAQVEACAKMTAVGVPAALFRVDTFQEYLSVLKICTDITGNESVYKTHGTDVEAQIRDVLEAVQALDAQQRSYLFIRAGSQYSSTKAKRAPDNFVCTMLDQLGAHNIADDAAVLLDSLSLEEIMLRDPDYIFLTTMGSETAARSYIADLFAQEGWRDLTAVKNGSYTFLPKELFHFKPNEKWADAYGLLAHLLYPELSENG